MQVYIEDRNGKKYFVEKLSRKAKIKLYGLSQKVDENENQFEKIEEMFYDVLKMNNPLLTREEYEDILDYNEGLYGFSQLYELIGAFVEEVFTQVGGENTMVHPYLAHKKEQKVEQAQVEVKIQQEPEHQTIY